MKETYSVKLPKQIIFGDPWYFERYSGEKLKSLIVNMNPPSRFEARVVLEEMQDEEYPEITLRSMSICMAPAETMQTYLQGMIYESQDHTVRQLGVDSAKYFLCVNNRMNAIHTGADGYWGDYQEMTRTINGKTYLDAAILTIAVPEDETMESMREWLNYYFEDVQQVENAPEPTEEQDDDIGINISQ